MTIERRNVCVDLDGVLADYSKGFRGLDIIGDPLPGAVEFTHALREKYRVVVYTTRCKEDVGEAAEGDPPNPNRGKKEELAARIARWLDEHGFAYDEVYVGQGKPWGVAYVDDRAVSCRPQDFGAGEFDNALQECRELAGE